MKNITYINAGAGSGKTYTLTTKLSELIANKVVEPEQVILTTFTKKAANEFREKAKAELYKIGKFDEASRLDQALIGTIDSVASELIQKYWYAIGISPKQGVMDDDAKATYINQSIANIPTDDDLKFFAEFRKTFNIIGEDTKPDYNYWKEHLKSIVEKSIGFDINDYSQSIEDSLYFLKKICKNSSICLTQKERKNVLDDYLVVLTNCRESKKKTSTIENIDAFKGRSQYLNDIQWMSEFAKILKEAPAWPKNTASTSLLDKAMQQSVDVWQSKEVYEMQEKYIQTIFRLAKEWNEQYTQYKLNKRIVDFNDMEHYMHQLLQNQEIAVEIGKTYTHLFVDEFQDCSPIQVKIFMALADVVSQSYWVGDTKQAIYGFRGSDTALTKAVADAIAEKAGNDNCTVETLKESWRSVPQLVELTNKTFTQIFQPIFGDKTNELVPLESAMENHPEKFEAKLKHLAPNPLRYLKLYEEKKEKSSTLAIEDIAQYILNIIDNEGVALSDIAILGRTGYSLDNIQYFLSCYNIPIDRETILDKESKACQLMMNLLNLAVNPQNNLARAEIAYLTEDEMSISKIIDSKLEYNHTPKEERVPWLSEAEMIKRVESIRSRTIHQGIGDLMETLVVELDIKNVVERWSRPTDQSMADIKALINVAKQYEQRSADMAQPATPTGFATFLSENDYAVPVSGNGVQLLTIHKAKGLEWKYVFLVLDECLFETQDILKRELYGVHHFHPQEPSATNLYPMMSIRLMPWIFGSRNCNVPDNLKNIIINDDYYTALERHTLNESARLLYVGMTRASEVLVLVPWRADKKFRWFEKSGLHDVGDIEGRDILNIQTPFTIVEAQYPEGEEEAEDFETREYRCLNYHSDRPSDAGYRDIAPSKIERTSYEVSVVHRGDFFVQIHSGKMHDRTYAEVGNCIHDVFAAIEGLDDGEAAEVIKMHEMDDVLPNTGDIIKSWKNLQAFLQAGFGSPIETYHERPFCRLLEDGTLMTGSIDYVYKTKEGSVLIDFKTYPRIEDITDPTSEHFAGVYAGQLDAYTSALEAAGDKVLKRFIYYPISGMVVEIG